MKSSACKCEEHTLCSTTGRVRLRTGKVIGCDCGCHEDAKRKREMQRLYKLARKMRSEAEV